MHPGFTIGKCIHISISQPLSNSIKSYRGSNHTSHALTTPRKQPSHPASRQHITESYILQITLSIDRFRALSPNRSISMCPQLH